MQTLQRKKCVICFSVDLEYLTAVQNFPVYMGSTEQALDKDVTQDMKWGICRKCGTLQLLELVPLNLVYQYNHNEAVGKLWHDHNEEFAEFIIKNSGASKLEIGGATGRIAQICNSLGDTGNWVIVEPNPIIELTSDNIHVHEGWFDSSFEPPWEIDTVIHSHVMEHWYSPNDTLRKIANILPISGKMICSFPQLDLWISRNYANALHFEHTYYIDKEIAEYLLSNHGFVIDDYKRFREHSYFISFKKVSGTKPYKLPNKYKINKEMFGDMISYFKDYTNKARVKLEKHNGPKYIFGAHVFSQYLFSLGLEQSLFGAILDNAPGKIGKRLYGSKLNIESPEILRDKNNVMVLLNCGAYNQEIAENIRSKINPDVIFC